MDKYDMTGYYYERILLKQDARGVDGRLLAEAGATGYVVSYDRDKLGVLFDDGPQYVELTGCQQRLQDVPTLTAQSLGHFIHTQDRRYRVTQYFRDNDDGIGSWLEQNPGHKVALVSAGYAFIAAESDLGEVYRDSSGDIPKEEEGDEDELVERERCRC